jgi:hypothetical protein
LNNVRVIEMGRAAFVQNAMAQIMGACVAARYFDETLFPPETRSRRNADPTNPPINDSEMQRIAQISVEAAEALLKAYGPIGFQEPM